MFARSTARRNPARRIALALLASLALTACLPATSVGTGPRVNPGQPVTVALLVPSSDTGGAAQVARGLQNAAQLAVRQSPGARIDLRVYDTAGTPSGAQTAAGRALADGAQIILGPLYSQNAAAVTQAVAGRNVNVLSFSNNTAVAGGNVYVLGQTFEDVARRLTRYAAQQGASRVAVVHAQDVAGTTGRDAILRALQGSSAQVATVQSYPLSQQGINQAGPLIAEAIRQSGATATFLTASADSDLPLIATVLPENGVDPARVRTLGLTRWNSLPQVLSLPGLQGGLFVLPDQSAVARFEAQYGAAYGAQPHPLAGLGYDAVRAVATLLSEGRRDALSGRALTRGAGFQGAYGLFRLRPDGTNDRALAVAQVQGGRVSVVDPAPGSFGAAGF